MKINFRTHQWFVSLATLGVLLGCSHNQPAPVYDLSSQSRNAQVTHLAEQVNNQFYTVLPGDTLFSIAWHHSADVEELAEINQLNNNLIYPEQKLALFRDVEQDFFDADSLLAAIHQEVLKSNSKIPTRVKSTGRLSSSSQSVRSQRNKSVKRSTHVTKTHNNPETAKTSQKLDGKSSITSSSSKLNQSKLAQSKQANKRQSNLSPKKTELKWIWPTDGKILANFSTKSNANRGVDIEAKLGQPVRATAPGRVVYEGNGLRGYGNLVIIKHSDDYLSAYAHNDKIHVSENEIVKSGQRIADVGSSGTHREKLHFEIRYKGKPVDPLNYLPEKQF